MRHLTHLHQPGASPRDPARLALISRRNTAVPANAPIHALRHDQRDRTEHEPWPAPDPPAAWPGWTAAPGASRSAPTIRAATFKPTAMFENLKFSHWRTKPVSIRAYVCRTVTSVVLRVASSR